MNHIRLYFRYASTSIKSQMIHKTAFLLQSLGHFLVTGIEILGVLALFSRFGSIRGWSLAQVAFFYGFMQFTFAVSDALGRGFDIFGELVKSGGFDAVLLRPRPAGLQVLGYEFTLRRIGRMAQGLMVLVWAIFDMGIPMDIRWISVMTLSFVGGVCLYMGIYHIQAAISFLSVESLEVMNIFTYGTVQAAQYPLSIYGKNLFRMLTFFIPLTLIIFYPFAILMERPETAGLPQWLAYIAPAAGGLFLAVGIGMWRIGMRYYASTGS